ncbi:MAG: hypothetical protein ACRCYO_14360, partial [Bacteroidia bacterium]
SLASQREHVTPFIKESGSFLCGFKKYRAGFELKLSVDTPDDFNLLQTVMKHFEPRIDFTVDELMLAFEQFPAWKTINASSVLNEGYIKSLQEDRTPKP